MLEKYPSDVNLVIKHFPLKSHKFAYNAAVAALAAEQQGKYLELTKEMLNNNKKLNDDTIKKLALRVGLDMEKFDKACNNPAVKKIIIQDMRLSRMVKVERVPAIFINGRIANRRSFKALSQMVDQALKKK